MWDLAVIAAAGGSVRGLLDAYEQTMAWRDACRKHLRQKKNKIDRPAWSEYYEVSCEISAAALQALIGGGVGVLFAATHQMESAWAAFLLGISAPAMLTYLVNSKSVNGMIAAQRLPHQIAPSASADAVDSTHDPQASGEREPKPDENVNAAESCRLPEISEEGRVAGEANLGG
ncbi:hypothetical protein [Streptomyces sp. NPDC048436]|uniref:hypothetical protein n=1 Tax=Streptomyces sp. NPDC048436 TaxID=3365550 RepID=UPI003722714F